MVSRVLLRNLKFAADIKFGRLFCLVSVYDSARIIVRVDTHMLILVVQPRLCKSIRGLAHLRLG